jgi:hypothetical protein
MAVGLIQQTKEGDIGREKTTLIMSPWLERATIKKRWQLLIIPLSPHVEVSVCSLM